MKTIGLIGGMSWHSTVEYYARINEQVARLRGGHASARLALQSLDFEEIRQCQLAGDWERSGQILADAARRLEAGGADLVAICTNLMHKNFSEVASATSLPTIHIADAVAREALAHGWSRIGLLGTRLVMAESFYADRLATHGIEVLVPDSSEWDEIDRVIFDELTLGEFLESSRATFVRVMNDLKERGAAAVALSCTEIGLLVPAAVAPLPMVDSATAHADLLVELSAAVLEPSS